MVIWIRHTVTGDMFIFLFIFFTLFHMFDSNQHTTPLSNNFPNSWQIPEHTAYRSVVHEVNSHCDQYPHITWSCLFTATPLPYCVSCQAQFHAESCKPSYIGNMPQFNPNNITAHKSTNRQRPHNLFSDLQYREYLWSRPLAQEIISLFADTMAVILLLTLEQMEWAVFLSVTFFQNASEIYSVEKEW